MTATPAPPASAAAPPAPDHRPVHGLLAATGLSVAGNAMVAVLVPWLVLQRTGSPAQAGLVGSVALAAAVPALLLGGPLIDRWGRRRVSAGADLLSAAAVAALPLLDHVVGLSLLSTLALVAVGALFDGPGGAAREASRPDVAAAAGAAVETVNARGEAAEGAGGIAGPALAGAGIGLVGALGSLWLAAALFVIAAAATWRSLPRDAAPAVPREPYLRAAGSGLRLVGRDRTLRAIAVLGMVAMLFVAPVPLVLAAHLEPQGQAGALGLVAAALALGGAVGALTYERVGTRGSRPAVLAGGLAAGAAGFAAMATLPGTVALAVLAGGTGLAVGPVNPVLAVLLQDRTPGGLRGRVVATTWSLSLIASPLGVLGAGLILEAAGPRAALLVIAAGCLLTSAYALAAPGLRRTPRPDLPDAPDAPDREGTRP